MEAIAKSEDLSERFATLVGQNTLFSLLSEDHI